MASYDVFIQDIGTVVMGWNTYHQISTGLLQEEWPYRGLTTYVVTYRKPPDTGGDIHFVDRDVCALSAPRAIMVSPIWSMKWSGDF